MAAMMSSSSNQPSSANVSSDPVEQEINEDMSFITDNIIPGNKTTYNNTKIKLVFIIILLPKYK